MSPSPEKTPGAGAPGPGATAGAGAVAPANELRRWLPFVGLAVGLWALLPKYVTPPLNTADTAEFADHVIPAILILGVSLACVARRNRQELSLLPLIAGMVIVLAGFWMVATHLPLMAQAFRGDAPWAGSIYHTTSAVAVFGLGLLWGATHWGDLAALEAAEASTGTAAKRSKSSKPPKRG